MNRLPGPKDLVKYIPAFIIIAALFIFLLALVNYAGNDGLKREVSDLDQNKTTELTSIKSINDELLNYEDLSRQLSEIKGEYYSTARSLEEEVIQGKSPYKIAYLTFDDGPFNLTREYLKVLDNYDVLATFFVLGKTDYLDIYKETIAKGHSLGNHTYSHQIRNGIYITPESFMADVDKLDLFLQENLGVKTRVFRFPGGYLSAGIIKEECLEALHESGYKYAEWNVLTRDAEVKDLTFEEAYANVMPIATTKYMPIILMHDFNSSSLAALPTIIEDLQTANYVLLPLFDNSIALK